MSHQNLSNQLIFVNLYEHEKNDAVSSPCSGEMLDLKIQQSEWLRAFWPISLNIRFVQEYRNTLNFYLNSKNPIFDLFFAHFLYFLGQKMFSQKNLACKTL